MGNLVSSFFFTPVFLGSLLAAGIPLVIHLIHRRRAPRLWFSTLRFLLLASRRTARRRQLHNILLLILRGLLFLLLTTACFNHNLILGVVGKGPVSVVIVLDNSQSMGCVHEAKTRFQRAREMAADIVAGLRTGDACALILTGGPDARQQPVLSHELERTSLRIAAARTCSERSDLAAALARADELLEDSAAPGKEVYLLSDMQAISWPASRKPPDIFSSGSPPVILVDFSRPDFSNQAVVGVEVDAPRPVVGSSAHIQAQIYNSNDFPHSDMVSLFVGAGKAGERTFAVEAHSSTEVAFDYPFNRAGLLSGYVELERDSLCADNRRDFFIQVSPRIEVLVVSEGSSPVPFLDSAFYLTRALDSAGGAGAGRSIETHQVDISRLNQSQLDEYACVVLADVAALDGETAKRLAAYVFSGGGLVIFTGERSAQDKLPEMFTQLFAPRQSPISVGYQKGDIGSQQEFWQLAAIDFEHPLFSSLKEEPGSLFDDVHVYCFLTCQVKLEKGIKVLARLQRQGQPLDWPFLVEIPRGSGRMMVFTSACDARWSNFPLKNLYLPVMHRLCYYLSRCRDAPMEQLAGRPVRFSFPHWQQQFTVEVTDPEPKTQELTSSFTTSSNEAVFADTYQAGIYQYTVKGPEEKQGRFIICPPAEEADLRPIPPDALKELLGARRLICARSREEMHKAALGLRQGYQLNHIIFFVVLAIALGECFLANRTKPNIKLSTSESAEVAA